MTKPNKCINAGCTTYSRLAFKSDLFVTLLWNGIAKKRLSIRPRGKYACFVNTWAGPDQDAYH
jgi:hypothetical protein